MEVRAVGKYIRVQPRKVRLIASAVKHKSAEHASNLLKFHPSKSARELRKVLVSAMANAVENTPMKDASMLRIKNININEGPVHKRIQARAQGRAYRILKRTSHITVTLDQLSEMPEKKQHGTPAKDRPTFITPKKSNKKSPSVENQTVESKGEGDALPEDKVQATASTEVEQEVIADSGENSK